MSSPIFFYSTFHSLKNVKRLNKNNKYELVRGKINRLFDRNIWSVGNKKILIATRDLEDNYVFVRLYRTGKVHISKKNLIFTHGEILVIIVMSSFIRDIVLFLWNLP